MKGEIMYFLKLISSERDVSVFVKTAVVITRRTETRNELSGFYSGWD